MSNECIKGYSNFTINWRKGHLKTAIFSTYNLNKYQNDNIQYWQEYVKIDIASCIN